MAKTGLEDTWCVGQLDIDGASPGENGRPRVSPARQRTFSLPLAEPVAQQGESLLDLLVETGEPNA